MKIVECACMIAFLGAGASAVPSSAADFTVTDRHGRNRQSAGVTLVDWEGPIANPAIRLVVRPPANAVFPLAATLTANDRRLSFDLPGTVGASGPSRALSFASASASETIYLSIFADADAAGEEHLLTITGGPNPPTTLPIHVVDQDVASFPPFQVILEFGQDQTGFFSDPDHREVIQQAAADWAYFISDLALDEVDANAEFTFIWDPDGFNTGHWELNASPYLGYLLYAYGIHSDELRSGGEPSSGGGFQSSGGTPLSIRRSGGTEIETAGNFNTLGWFVSTDPGDWWVSGNFGDEPNDLFSISHHEIGHALFFNPANPVFADFKTAGSIDDAAVVAYHGAPVVIDAVDHFDGEVDRASRRGAFGYEFYGSMPARRWQITKLDLLCAQAIGYTLRQTSAFVDLEITDATLATGTTTAPYSDAPAAGGGVPAYRWTLDSGSLPPGLALDSFTGAIAGTPTTAGTFLFVVRLEDEDEMNPGVTAATRIVVNNVSGVEPGGRPPLALLPATPNPVFGVATLRFNLADEGPARLTLYDAQGRLRRTLFAGRAPAGWHAVSLDAAGLANGVYYLQLESAGASLTNRVTVAR